MRYLTILLIIMALINSTPIWTQDLEPYKWEKRILLLKDTHFESDVLQVQLTQLQSSPEKLQNRDLVILIITDEAVYDISRINTKLHSMQIVKKYGLADFRGLLLIGKDGGIKLKESFVVNPESIFNLIDSMPMRQAEMKSSKKY